ncbi:MAG: SdrD B-like domain-containing protein [Desulfobacteraceae bacterium]
MGVRKKRIFKWVSSTFFLTWVTLTPWPSPPQASPDVSPEPNPPRVEQKTDPVAIPGAMALAPLADREWIYHKTADGLHPDGNEQQLMWFMNRARANPSQEGAWLAATGDPDVEDAIDTWEVDLTVLQNEFDTYDAKPPAAFDVRLYNAARDHAEALIARDSQDHLGQFELINDYNFYYYQARAVVFSYTLHPLFGHAGFNIDWGPDDGDGTGMQPDRGHRMAIMSVDGEYTNVGYAMVPEFDPDTGVGPLVTTGDFCMANPGYADHYNRFLVGTVWQDANGNDQYDPGEGMGGITVMPDSGTYFAITANSGGYAFPILSAGTYEVTFSGFGITPAISRTSVVGGESVLLDLKYSGSSADEPQATTDPASDITTTSVSLNGRVYTSGHDTDYYFQYGTTTGYGTDTATDTVSTDTAVSANVSGLNEGAAYHYRLVVTNSHGTSYGIDQTFRTETMNSSDGSSAPPPAAPSSGGGGCFIWTAGE